MGDHPKLRDLYLALDLNRVDEMSSLTNFFSHSCYEHDILHVHLTGFFPERGFVRSHSADKAGRIQSSTL